MNRAQGHVIVLAILQLFVIGVLLMASVIPISGCAKVEADRDALRQLQGQRVGLVVRALKYVYGELEGVEPVQRGAHVAVDAPLVAYSLAVYDSENLKNELSQIFEVVLLGSYFPINDENMLNFDGELVLVNPSSQRFQIPFDQATRSVMEEHALDGIIFIDQHFSLFSNLSLIGCSSHVTIADASGRVIFQRELGLLMEAHARFSSFTKDFLRAFSEGLLGEATSDEIDQAIRSVSSQAAEAVRRAIEASLLQK